MFDGATGMTVSVSSEYAVAEPPAFVAVTATVTRVPTSALVSVYVAPVAPEMFVQPPPYVHRSHWYPYVNGGVPPHLPSAAVNTAPSTGLPRIEGGRVLCGASGFRFHSSVNRPHSP